MIGIIIHYWKATRLGFRYWRVTYPDGRRTRLLYWNEANSLKEVFGGKLWIDYSILQKPKEV